MLEVYNGALDVEEILSRWYRDNRTKNYGAFVSFTGTVRDENGIDGLSFDLYKPLLISWLAGWQEIASKKGAVIALAHSQGDVPLFTSSYVTAVWSPKRRVALELIDPFVEDFKAKAPIWKYDLVGGKRVFASDRAFTLAGSGLLA